jgi:hypothetical protein
MMNTALGPGAAGPGPVFMGSGFAGCARGPE